jgi:hypothetical protein
MLGYGKPRGGQILTLNVSNQSIFKKGGRIHRFKCKWKK